MDRIYLDNNATTILDPRIKDAMEPFWCQLYGNPNSLHTFGTEVHPYMRLAFDRLYAGINARDSDDIILTSCATESNNTVLHSVWYDLIRTGRRSEIVTTQVEHPAVSNTCRYLESLGAKVVYLPVNSDGIVDAGILREHIDPERTALVSIMWANNETGLLFPIRELAALCREKGILFHTDAVQAGGYLDLNVDRLSVDLLSLSGHKFYAPKGVGVLYARQGTLLLPQQTGGGHEGNRRAGTENIPYIVGLATALRLAQQERASEAARLSALRDRLVSGIRATIPDAQLTGHPERRLPGHASLVIPGVEAGGLLMHLDMAGVCAASGSACTTGMPEPSHVLLAMGVEHALALGALRLTLGRSTTQADVDYVVEILPGIVEKLRTAQPVYAPVV